MENKDSAVENINITLEVDLENYKILIVDDVLSNIMLLKALLKTKKFQVITASDGYQALEKVETDTPDVILLDVMMPGINGFEVAEKLQSDTRYCDIPIIFLTALNSHEDIVKGFQFGGNDFITKPFNKNELLVRLNHQISLLEAKRIIMKQTEELRSIIVGRDKLYSVIAHDLRGPLGSIKMVLNLLITSLGTVKIDPSLYEMLSIANQTTEEVFTLLDNLLKWTKTQLNRLNVAFSDYDISDIIQDGIDVFQTTAALKNITISYENGQSCNVRIDADMIKTVVRNLISNAIKFSHNGGEIIISSDISNDDYVTVRVKDNGCGIKEEDKPKLLNAETHFSSFGTNSEEGSGLGLLLCNDFIVKNGGNLWFESKEGVGSEFFFTILKSKEESVNV